MIHLLFFTLLQRLSQLYPQVKPRALMDDVSFQWVGPTAKQATQLFSAVKWFTLQTVTWVDYPSR